MVKPKTIRVESIIDKLWIALDRGQILSITVETHEDNSVTYSFVVHERS